MKQTSSFEWDPRKNTENIEKHGVSFEKAQHVFDDPKRVIAADKKHSTRNELRYFCFGRLEEKIITVRFIWRNGKIRIFGAGYWREGKKKYEEKDRIH